MATASRPSRIWTPITYPVGGCRVSYVFEITGLAHRPGCSLDRDESNVVLHLGAYEEPLSWEDPHVVPVCPTADIFHPRVPDKVVQRLFRVMTEADHHVYLTQTRYGNRLSNLAPTLPSGEHISVTVAAR